MAVDEIAPGIYRWTAPHPEWRTRIDWGHEVASYALADGERLSLVDALLPAAGTKRRDEVDRTLDDLAGAASSIDILVTIPYHTRSAEELYRRYNNAGETSIWGHPAVAKRFHEPSTPLREIAPGVLGATGTTALRIGNPRRFETPLYFPAHRAIAFGDAVIGIDGGLRVWQQASTDPSWHLRRFVPTMRPLLELDVECVLVTHGAAVLHDGRRALGLALDAGPWDYRG